MEVELIDEVAALKTFINNLHETEDEHEGKKKHGKGNKPHKHKDEDEKSNLYVDLEGNNLSRHGTLSLITILVEPRHTVHLIDVTTLSSKAFNVSGSDGQTLKDIFESAEITKIFFDIRNDSDALFSLFGIRIAGIEDLQLMELGARFGNMKLLKGLGKAIEQDTQLSPRDLEAWNKVKNTGKKLFSPESGGDFAVFDQRPLSLELQKYSVQDVLHMPTLHKTYLHQLSQIWKVKVEEETAARIVLFQSAEFNGQGKHMAKGPSTWQKKITTRSSTSLAKE